MLELLNNYSISEILTFLVIFALAFKSVVSFWDWGVDRLKKVFNKETNEQKEKDLIQERLDKGNSNFVTLFDNQTKQNEKIEKLMNMMNTLIDSDKDDIKSFLTREHHYFCYQKGWIDDYSLECCEKRYQHYEEEGGNSFIKGFMNDLRALPKQPQNTHYDK